MVEIDNSVIREHKNVVKVDNSVARVHKNVVKVNNSVARVQKGGGASHHQNSYPINIQHIRDTIRGRDPTGSVP